MRLIANPLLLDRQYSVCNKVNSFRRVAINTLLLLIMSSADVLALAPDSNTGSKVLLTNTQGATKLTLEESKEGNVLLSLKKALASGEYEVISLDNPHRLVLDVKNLNVESGKVLPVVNSNLVKQIRFGTHQNTGRIVLDLTEGVEYQIENKGDGIALSFNSKGTSQTAKVLPVDKVVSSIKQDHNPASKQVAVKNEPDTKIKLANKLSNEKAAPSLLAKQVQKNVELVKNLPTVTNSAAKEQKIEQKAPNTTASKIDKNMARVTDVSLQNGNSGENVIVARMDSPGIYTFERSAPSEYVLTLEDATIDQAVKPTLIAGAGAGSIRSVRAVQQGEFVKLRIFADPLTDLEAKTENGAIVIAAVKDSLINKERIMAQADVGELLDEDQKNEPEVKTSELKAPQGDEDLSGLLGGDTTYTGRLISLDLQDTEIDNALRIIAEVSNLNIIASDNVTGKVTLRLIDVPWDQALDVILKTNGLDKVQEGNVVRIAPVEKLRAEREALRQAQQAEDELEPLRVQYMRVSYAKAAELQPLVETVLTERGGVSHDARTNQLIIKDIAKGIKNAARLVQKLDLRTPQVLIETQIVEAKRSFIRDLGSELGFTFVRSPETGNALGYNFPNSVSIGGSAEDTRGTPVGVGPIASFFPSTAPSSAVSALFSSADGTKSLSTRISAAESEGRIRVVSRPSVAVTNNSPAVIKSVEKLRIRLPSGGVSVATGQGAAAGSGGSVATEIIEVGIVLNVTAQASPDYYVLLDINAKSSSLGTLSQAVDDIPPEIERSTTSTVLISSGQTFAMGGIYRISEDSSIVGVPFLKDIPVLGSFFRRTGVNDRDEELIFFMTPRIIEGSFDDATMKVAS